MAELTQNFTLAWRDINTEGYRLAHKMEEAMRGPPGQQTARMMAYYDKRLDANDDTKRQALARLTTAARLELHLLDEQSSTRLDETLRGLSRRKALGQADAACQTDEEMASSDSAAGVASSGTADDDTAERLCK